MITKISKLEGIGKFSNINQEKNFQFGVKGQNCNIIFGFNGSGKTTISNSISFFANNSFISEDEKREIFEDLKNDQNSYIEMILQGGSSIKYPAQKDHNKDIYVFNTNFISSHIFNGTKSKIKKFSNIGGEIKNTEIEEINKKIFGIDEESKKLDDENKTFYSTFEEISGNKSKDFNKTLSITGQTKVLQRPNLITDELPEITIEQIQQKISELSIDYTLSKKQEELNTDIVSLTSINLSDIKVDFIKIDDILIKNVQQLSKDVLDIVIKDIQQELTIPEDKQKVEGWFKFGKNILESIKSKDTVSCPVCNTNITEKISSILDGYQGYFDKAYEDFIKELDIIANNISTIIKNIEKYKENIVIIETLKLKYENLLVNKTLTKYDFTNVLKYFNDLDEKLKAKKENIQNKYLKDENIEKELGLLNINITECKNIKDELFGILSAKKINPTNIEKEIRENYKNLILLEFNSKDEKGALDKYKKNSTRIEEIKTKDLPKLKNDLTAELKKIKVEAKSISKFLLKMGIDNFDIDINEDVQDENIIIKYKASGKEKDKLRNSLSDGEKTALAFAYFLSKLKNELNSEEKINEAIVVIDDPISSLDDNRLYSTASLIFNSFENVRQLILLSHNFLFLKHFNSFYKDRANCLFLSNETLSELPYSLKNFETPYFFMLQELVDFDKGILKYEECNKYLPNYSRRVLETFLSFKFAKISSDAKQSYSPGLGEFNENIEKTNLDEKIKEDLISKIEDVKSISDKFSHGNLQHTQESFYISPQDLRSIVKNTLFTIETMDNLHKTCFDNSK